VALEVHANLLALFQKRASQAHRVLAAKPFETSRADDLMVSTDHDTNLYNDVYTLP
jgi:hypothetical protein